MLQTQIHSYAHTHKEFESYRYTFLCVRACARSHCCSTIETDVACNLLGVLCIPLLTRSVQRRNTVTMCVLVRSLPVSKWRQYIRSFIHCATIEWNKNASFIITAKIRSHMHPALLHPQTFYVRAKCTAHFYNKFPRRKIGATFKFILAFFSPPIRQCTQIRLVVLSLSLSPSLLLTLTTSRDWRHSYSWCLYYLTLSWFMAADTLVEIQ